MIFEPVIKKRKKKFYVLSDDLYGSPDQLTDQQ